MNDTREKSAIDVLKECFWGDYNLTAQEILDHLNKKDTGFNSFLFSKIIENSNYPSLHIKKLFAPEIYTDLLNEYLKRSGGKKRIRLIAANITGNMDHAPEYKWQR